MEKFTLKIGKELRCYELDEDKKQLHITVQKRKKVTWKQNVDLQNVYANFYELLQNRCSAKVLPNEIYVKSLVKNGLSAY